MYRLVSNEFDCREDKKITYICYGVSKDDGAIIMVNIFTVSGQNQPMYIGETSEKLEDHEIQELCLQVLAEISETGQVKIEGFNPII